MPYFHYFIFDFVITQIHALKQGTLKGYQYAEGDRLTTAEIKHREKNFCFLLQLSMEQ